MRSTRPRMARASEMAANDVTTCFYAIIHNGSLAVAFCKSLYKDLNAKLIAMVSAREGWERLDFGARLGGS